MSNYPKKINILECGPREGFQFEKKMYPVADKLRMINDLVAAGVRDIEVGSYVSPQAVPQMANTDEVVAQLNPRDGVIYRVLVFGKSGLEKVLQEPKVHHEGMVVTASTDTFLKANLGKSIDETYEDMKNWLPIYRKHNIPVDTFGMMSTFGCNYEGDIPIPHVLGLIDRAEKFLKDNGHQLKTLRIADTMGWANPLQIKRVIGAIQDRFPGKEIRLHLHDTRGTGLANCAAAMEMGITHHDSSVGGLGGCPFASHKGPAGNICTEDVVFMAHEMGIETGIDLDKLVEVANWAEALVGHPLPGKIMKAGSLERFRKRARAA